MTPERHSAIVDALGREPERIVEIDDGYDFFVAIVDDAEVFRFPRWRDAEEEDPETVAAFLTALHGMELPLERPPWRDEYVERAERFARDVLPLLDKDLRPRAQQLLHQAETLAGFDPVPIHGDVLPEHLRCRDGRLVGVIDWGDARVGDPALDYAWLLNGPFPHWEVDDDLRRRGGFYHRLEPWVWAHYGLVTNKPGHVRAGLAEISSRL